MNTQQLVRRLFAEERQRIADELRYRFSISVEDAEDIVSDTFLSATELWREEHPRNPQGWLHTVARNKARNCLKKRGIFERKLVPELKRLPSSEEFPVDVVKNESVDSQLAMIFKICHPSITAESQIGLALHLLCGLGIQEVADSFFTTRPVIYKRLERAREKLKINRINIEYPTSREMSERLERVLTVLYLLFSEGYFSFTRTRALCEGCSNTAMELTAQLLQLPVTATPATHALYALMCFHASRFQARANGDDAPTGYYDQDYTQWSNELISRGNSNLRLAASGNVITRFHLEAGIAYWHTHREDSQRKWQGILSLYDKLLALEYSPVVALNRIYALAKVKGTEFGLAAVKTLNGAPVLYYRSLLSFLNESFHDNQRLVGALQDEDVFIFSERKVAVG